MNPVNSVTNENPQKLITNTEAQKLNLEDSPYCQSNCKVCNSPFHGLIMDKIRKGETYRDISAFLLGQHNTQISIASLSRHKKNYNRALIAASHKIDFERFDVTAHNVATHQKEVLFLMKESFKQILDQIVSGSLRLSIGDYKDLTKLYYDTLRDPDSAGDEDIMALFQKVSEKQGISVQQGILFKPKRRSGE